MKARDLEVICNCDKCDYTAQNQNGVVLYTKMTMQRIGIGWFADDVFWCGQCGCQREFVNVPFFGPKELTPKL
jgi:hypothetical protein